jgi:flagellin-like protein
VIEKKMIQTKNKARSFVQVRRSRSKSGVSPVIGVILMVAATIVIAGVVMAMLGGFGPPKRVYMVTATASEMMNTTGTTIAADITITCTGGPDANQLDTAENAFNITLNGANLATADKGTLLTDTSDYTGLSSIFWDKGSSGPNNDHVIVIAKFTDGTTQVILDTYV